MSDPLGDLNDLIESIFGGIGSFINEYPYVAGTVLVLAIILRRTIKRARR